MESDGQLGGPPSDITDTQVSTFISNAPLAMAMFDRDMRYVTWSQLWANRYGIAGRDLRGVSHYDLFPDLPAHFIDAHRRALAGEEISCDGEWLELAPDKKTYERWRTQPVIDAQGDITGVAIFSEDLTAQKLAEERLQDSKKQLKFVINVLDAGVIEWEFDTAEISASQNACKKLGLDGHNAPVDLDSLIALLKPTDKDRFLESLHRARDPRTDGVFSAHIAPVIAGRVRKMQFIGQVLFSAAGKEKKPSGFVGVLLDKTAWQDFEMSSARSQSLESIGRITGIITHDFNNLLSVILANVELAKLRVSDTQTNEFLQNAIQAAEIGGGFNKRLLALSGIREAAPQLIRLDDHILSIWVMFERLMNEHIALKFLPGAKDLCVLMDPAELDGAILNLVVNAHDAQPKGGTISIATHIVDLDDAAAAEIVDGRQGHFLELSVSDEGKGMTKSEIARASEPFFTTKPRQMGSGLGLTSVATAMARIHGFMAIQSEPGEGTKVSLFLPIARGLPVTRDQKEPMPLGNGELVLVVEDDALVREATLNRLEALGYAVIAASNGQAALDLLAEGEPVDLVFSDVVMPGDISGFDLEEMISTRYSMVGVLLATGHTSQQRSHAKTGARGAEILKKPYSLAALAQAVERAINQAATLR